MKMKPLTNKEGEVRELTLKDFRNMSSAAEVLPEDLLANLPKRKKGNVESRMNLQK